MCKVYTENFTHVKPLEKNQKEKPKGVEKWKTNQNKKNQNW
jgi:hypothetical protein